MKKLITTALMLLSTAVFADTALITGDGSIVGACQINNLNIDYASPGSRVMLGNHSTYRKQVVLAMGCPSGTAYRLYTDNSSSPVPIKMDGAGGVSTMNVYLNFYKDSGFSQYLSYPNGVIGVGTGNLQNISLYTELSSTSGYFTEFTNNNVQYNYINTVATTQLFVEF